MDFTPDKKHEFVRKTVREFTQKEVAPLAAEIDRNHRFPHETVKKMADLGLFGIPFPTEYEGAGGDYMSYAITIEEISKACCTTSVIICAHMVGVSGIYMFGNEEQKRKYLPDLCSGRKLGAFALTEAYGGSDAVNQQTKAEFKDGKWVLNGAKCFITNGETADIYIVMATTDRSKGSHGITAFIVEKDDPGFEVGKVEDKMGVCGSSTTDLIFTDCAIPEDRVLGGLGNGFKLAMVTLDGGRIGIGAQAVGVAEGAFDIVVEHMKQRKQFGKPLSKMQALAFEMAALRSKIEGVKLMVYQAADKKDRGLDHTFHAAMAKYLASEVAMEVTTKCVQFMGGYGYSREFPVERMMRDAKVMEIYEGTSEVQKIVISGRIFK